MVARDAIPELQQRVKGKIIGQEAMIEWLLLGLLANGDLFVEGFPGLAKRRTIKSLAKHLEVEFWRL
jgi:MoxR-like ATPase